MIKALLSTSRLFEKLSRKIAIHKAYQYPDKACECAKSYLEV